MALFSFELGPAHIDVWASAGSSEEINPQNLHRYQQRTRGDIVKSATSELNRKTGELNGNTNFNKISYLAPVAIATRTGARAGRCAIGWCALADTAVLLVVQSNICSQLPHALPWPRAQAVQLMRTP